MNNTDFRDALVVLLPDLRAYARFLARRRADSDDLVQEALVRAIAASAQFREGSSLRAWMFTVLRNAFFEQSRRHRTEQGAISQSSVHGSGGPEQVCAPSQQDCIDLDDLSRHLFTLTPLLRDALVLVGAQGFGYEEAAGICGVPVGTMKARVARARDQLARAMATGRVSAA